MTVNSSAGNRRVLIVARWPVGGIRTYLRDLFAAPSLGGYQFVLVAPDADDLGAYVSEGRLSRAEWIRAPDSPRELPGLVARTARRLRPRLVHSHGFTSGAVCDVACLLTGYRQLLTVHEVLLDSHFRGLKGRARDFAVGVSVGLADQVHCVTEDSRQNLLDRYSWMPRLSRKIVVIPHGVDTAKIVGARPRDLAGELGCSADTVILGFLGRFMAPKGFRVLMKAMALLSEEGVTPERLRVLAVGSGGFLREDRATLATMGLESFFTFWPYQPDVASILKSITCMVMPSLWEASGLLAMEAMVAGTPVIGTSCIGLRETLANTPALQTRPGDPADLARAIAQLLAERPAAAAASMQVQAARFQQEALTRFAAERTFSRLAEQYERL